MRGQRAVRGQGPADMCCCVTRAHRLPSLSGTVRPTLQGWMGSPRSVDSTAGLDGWMCARQGRGEGDPAQTPASWTLPLLLPRMWAEGSWGLWARVGRPRPPGGRGPARIDAASTCDRAEERDSAHTGLSAPRPLPFPAPLPRDTDRHTAGVSETDGQTGRRFGEKSRWAGRTRGEGRSPQTGVFPEDAHPGLPPGICTTRFSDTDGVRPASQP